MDETTGGPRLILGTKCPSITSRCSTSAPPLSTFSISALRFEKSAERIDGAIVIARPNSLYPPKATCEGSIRGWRIQVEFLTSSRATSHQCREKTVPQSCTWEGPHHTVRSEP